MKITDLASAVAPNAQQHIVGIRVGEKLHEQMIGEEDAASTYSYDGYYKILPVINGWSGDPERIKNGEKVVDGFIYNSANNEEWMTIKDLQEWLHKNIEKIGKI